MEIPEKLKKELERKVRRHQIDSIKEFSCYWCEDWDTCPVAWDLYNLDNECLMEK